MEGLLKAVKKLTPERLWGSAVRLARDGAVIGVSDDGQEIFLHVKGHGRAAPYEVYLWPQDSEWGCNCGLPGAACIHVVAATISLNKNRKMGKALPEAEKEYKVRLRYDFVSTKAALSLTRVVVWPNDRTEPLTGSLADSNFVALRGDVQAEGLLVGQGSGPLKAEVLRRLLVFLEGKAEATLDGKPVVLSPKSIPFQVRVIDEGEDFRVGLYRPSGIKTLFRGAALVKGKLRPTSHGELTREQRQTLMRGIVFPKTDVMALVSDYIPRLADRIPVKVMSKRLPQGKQLEPTVEVKLSEEVGGLAVKAELVYGDPPIARVSDGVFRVLSDIVPGRDFSAERAVSRVFEDTIGLTVGFKHQLPPEKAVVFLKDRLPKHRGPVKGRVKESRFSIQKEALVPQIQVREAGTERWFFDVSFDAEFGGAGMDSVMRAWQTGRSLVPLLDGGYAPLPMDWLREHGPILLELMESRDRSGTVGKQATASLVELLEKEENAVVPPDLQKLKTFLEGDDGLREVPLPEGFTATLRPYQMVGYHWLQFLRDVELNGILADDMGLGKTVQTLCAIQAAGGQNLVVCPTSVIRNWERECSRFAPTLTVNIYHGPSRQLDESNLILTSYAILRLDVEKLGAVPWKYLVLDEAQAIKNPSSQTAKAACQVGSSHRLALTGTPIENRLDELWSLFRFLMPGFLGSRRSFRDRFVRPIEAGENEAQVQLRRRVRPYIMRRLKRQVAQELPELTEIIVRCEMGPEQRKLYEAVRMSARADVQRAMGENGAGGASVQILEALLRMRQACCDPALLPASKLTTVPSCKLDKLEEMLVELVCDGHKTLIFSQWTSLLDQVELRLKSLDINWVRLDGATRNRQKVIDDFQDDDGPPIFLLSLKAGGTGLNLTAADYVVHLDPWWNPAVQQQATDRAHRIGQKKPVVSCRFIAADTVEERILELQDAKRALADAALGVGGGLLKALTAADLRELFDDAEEKAD